MIRTLLVYYPGYPYTTATLMPRAVLAGMAGALADAGYGVVVKDFGAIEHLTRFDREALAHVAGGNGGQRRARRQFMAHEAAGCTATAQAMAADGPADLVVLEVARREDFSSTFALCRALRAAMPGVTLLWVGAAVRRYAEVLVSAPAFHALGAALVTGDAEPAAVAVASRLAAGHAPFSAPNLLVGADGASYATALCPVPDLDALPWPTYARSVYPAVHGTGKLKLFHVADSRGCDYAGFADAVRPLEWRTVRSRKPGAVCAELVGLNRQVGARAVHFTGAGTPAATLDALAYEILARCLYVRYSRTAHVRNTDPSTVATLAASGCHALEFGVDTGSQRLLEDFYGHSFGVSEVEQVLRACHAAGVFVSARFTFPCPEDDRHTRAETLRLLRRAQPDAVVLRAPDIAPGSRWAAHARSFGFRIDARRYARWVFEGGVPVAGAEPALPWRSTGWRNGSAARARDALVTVLQGEGFAFEVTADEALVARMAGVDPAGEVVFAHDLRAALARCDAEDAAELVDRFNSAAAAPVNTVAFPKAVSLRAVAGN
ncbi:MAG: B12-binding domain-containing radical SAM protein [Candidatus Hydrogenedentota bacterium]